MDAVWKETDSGSAIEDIHGPENNATKAFLAGDVSPVIRFQPEAWYGRNRWAVYARLDWGDSLHAVAGVQIRY